MTHSLQGEDEGEGVHDAARHAEGAEEALRGDVAPSLHAHSHVRGQDGVQESRGGGQRVGRRGEEVRGQKKSV